LKTRFDSALFELEKRKKDVKAKQTVEKREKELARFFVVVWTRKRLEKAILNCQ
jgi:hypothetical protein